MVKTHAFLRHPIENWCLVRSPSIGPVAFVADIIRHDQDDIGFRSLPRVCRRGASSDVGENPDEGGSRVGHVRIDAAFFFPELADPRALLGFEAGHYPVDVGLVAASLVVFGKRILVDAGEKLPGIGIGGSGGGLIRSTFLRLLRGGKFIGREPFRGIGHDTSIDCLSLFLHSGDQFGALFRDIVLLADILYEVIQLNTADLALFEFGDPRLFEVVQGPVLLLQSIGFRIGESPIEHASAKIQSAQLFLEIGTEDFFDLLHDSIGGFEVNRRHHSAGGEQSVVSHSHDHVRFAHPEEGLMPLERSGLSEKGREVGSVEMHASGFLNADQSAEGGQEVDGSSWLVLDAAARNSVFPVNDAGNAVPAFELRSFFAAEFSAALLPVTAVIRRVNDDGVVELAQFFELGDESSDGSVGVVDGAVVDGGLIVERTILGDDPVRRSNDGVRFVEP